MAQINKDAPNIYHPEYDINTGLYVDNCPFLPRQTGIIYVCHCNHKSFTCRSEYSYHIKLKSHQRYITNYREMIDDLSTAKSYISNLHQKNVRLESEVAMLKRKLNMLTNTTPTVIIQMDEVD